MSFAEWKFHDKAKTEVKEIPKNARRADRDPRNGGEIGARETASFPPQRCVFRISLFVSVF